MIVLLAALAVLPLKAQDSPVANLSRDSILIGDQVRWSVAVRLNEGETCAFSIPQEPVAPNVETIRGFAVDTLKSRKGVLSLEAGMTITCFDEGRVELPPMYAVLAHADGTMDTLCWVGPVLEVGMPEVDVENFEPFDIKDQIPYPLTFREVLPWALGVLVLAALVYCLVRLIRNLRRNRDFFGREKVVDPPHVVALRSLDKIRAQKLWENDRQKQFYTAITDTLRQYMASFYGFPAMEETTAEIFDELKDKQIDARLLDTVQELFSTADYVKFAKHSASQAENEEAIPTAVKFVNTTYMQRLEAEAAAKQKEEE